MQGFDFRIRLIALLVALGVMSGCAATPMTEQLTVSPPQGLPQFSELSDTPFFAQTQYSCGPAALATVMNTTGLAIEPDGLADSVYTPGREGTLQTEILTGARRQGRLALPVRDLSDAFENITLGRPVLILQNLSLEFVPIWHYAVMIGYDLPDKTVLLRSGTTRRLEMPMETFEHTWRRSGYWGVVIVRPEGPVPEKSTLSEWLLEALGLERAGHSADALTALTLAARHWPESTAPLIAAANIQIGQDQLQDAKINLQAALYRQPDNAVALNNLAHIQMVQGDLEAAEKNALRAVSLGGSTKDTAQETLSAIRALKQQR